MFLFKNNLILAAILTIFLSLSYKNEEKKKMFKVVIGECEFKPEEIDFQIISSTSDGRFFGIQGERLSDKYIKKYLSDFSVGNKSVLLLQLRSEETTTISHLSAILSRLKKLADPKNETTVYIHISNV